MYRKSYCTTVGIGVGGGGVDKMFKFYVKVFSSDVQGTVWRAILYTDRSCSNYLPLSIFFNSFSEHNSAAVRNLLMILGRITEQVSAKCCM